MKKTLTRTDQRIAAWLSALQLVPREEQKGWIHSTLAPKHNLPIFGWYFFPHLIRDSVPDIHVDLLRELARRGNGAAIIPRGHAKSTWEEIDTIHDLVYKAEPVILYISDTVEAAMLHFQGIRTELENNDGLRDVYGNIVPPENDLTRKWTDKHIQTTNGVALIARGRCKGRGVRVNGQRPTKIIIDDAEDDEQIRNPDQRRKFAHWLKYVILPSLDKDRGFVKMIGTVLHWDCELLRFYNQHGGIYRKAIENGKPVWWSMAQLEKKKADIGSIAFAQEFMNEATNDETALVRFDWLRFYERGKEPPNLAKYSFTDVAISERDTADFFTIVTIGVDEQGGIWVLDLVRDHFPFHVQVEKVIHSQIKHNNVSFGVESVAYQRALAQEVSRQSASLGVYVPVIPVTPDGDKTRRLTRISPLIENGTIHFLREHTDLIDELTQFPNAAHDDTVDALTGAVLLLTETSKATIDFLD